ncbi:uncharacterized protein LOC121994328 [Zingiber officinale]|uniref:DUF868 family protein n=1 Tax=Zingiber officinale TaxID=94328 RepID=A0A8J5G406_ZINOF|nr:uncharacterized protein LOC121994328 [Zingiber officinale]KAG6501035.1 hypothetical protein ZIOFF_040901 [Zingiber officinale]
MPDHILRCFRGRAASEPPPTAAATPTLTTSVYETRFGVACLTWTRTSLGVSLRSELRFYADEEEEEEMVVSFHIRPWLLWKRRGKRGFHLTDHRRIDFAWDFKRASFPPGGGPEPVSGYFVAAFLDGAMFLVAGDLADAAHRKFKAHPAQNPLTPPPISRREQVVLVDHGGRSSYRTRARFGGQDHEISIDLDAKEKGREAAMSVDIDGERILLVRRLRWKFRGSEKVEHGGSKIQVSWDLHNWFFQAKDKEAAAGGAAEMGHAVFLFRFEEEDEEEQIGNPMLATEGYNGKNWNTEWSKSSGDGDGWERRRGRRKLRKTGSSSSSASTASTLTVMEWASPEEEELRFAEGFSLSVYAWKSW